MMVGNVAVCIVLALVAVAAVDAFGNNGRELVAGSIASNRRRSSMSTAKKQKMNGDDDGAALHSIRAGFIG